MPNINGLTKFNFQGFLSGKKGPDASSGAASPPAKAGSKPAGPSPKAGGRPATSQPRDEVGQDDLQKRFQALKDSMPTPAGRPGAAAGHGEGYLSRLQQKHFEAGKANAKVGADKPERPWNFPFDSPAPSTKPHVPASGTDHPWNFPFDSPEQSGGFHATGGHAPTGEHALAGAHVPSEGHASPAEHASPSGANPSNETPPPKADESKGMSTTTKIVGATALAGLALWALDQPSQPASQGGGVAI